MHAFGTLDVFLQVTSGEGSNSATGGSSADSSGGGGGRGGGGGGGGGGDGGVASWGGSGAGTLVRCIAPDFDLVAPDVDLVGVGGTAEVEVTIAVSEYPLSFVSPLIAL
jgi:hypothetical protein